MFLAPTKAYPFILEGAKDSGTVCVFESPIEAMSYRTLCKITGRGDSLPDGMVVGLNNDTEKFGHTINAGRNGAEKIQKLYGEILCRVAPLPVPGRLERRAEELQAESRREVADAAKPGADADRLKIRAARQGNITQSVASK